MGKPSTDAPRHGRQGPVRAALYARVSTTAQDAEIQLDTLRAFASSRGWTSQEFVDAGVSGAVQSRPALDTLLGVARRRGVDIVACVKLDRLARSTHHLVTMVREFESLGVDLVVLDQAIDTTTPSGRLLFHVLAAIAEFERDLIRDRVVAGLRRAQALGRKIGRPSRYYVDKDLARAMLGAGLSVRAVARSLMVHPTAVSRMLAKEATRLRIEAP
jgi:DNA invertase Pin-like site-specific DNA recombinase